MRHDARPLRRAQRQRHGHHLDRLAVNEDFEFGLGSFEGWSQIGQPLPTWESAYDPVTLTDAGGAATWSAQGSSIDSWDESQPEPLTWTFSPAP